MNCVKQVSLEPVPYAQSLVSASGHDVGGCIGQ